MTFATMQAGGGGFAERWRITNTGEFQAAAAQTISTAAGNLTLSAAGGNDLFLGNAVTTTMVVLDGGLDHIGLWQGPSSSRQLRIRYPAESVGTESSFYRAQHAPAGTLTVTGVVTTTATVAFNEPNITESGGSVVTAATVYIGSAPTEATNNYGIFP